MSYYHASGYSARYNTGSRPPLERAARSNRGRPFGVPRHRHVPCSRRLPPAIPSPPTWPVKHNPSARPFSAAAGRPPPCPTAGPVLGTGNINARGADAQRRGQGGQPMTAASSLSRLSLNPNTVHDSAGLTSGSVVGVMTWDDIAGDPSLRQAQQQKPKQIRALCRLPRGPLRVRAGAPPFPMVATAGFNRHGCRMAP